MRHSRIAQVNIHLYVACSSEAQLLYSYYRYTIDRGMRKKKFPLLNVQEKEGSIQPLFSSFLFAIQRQRIQNSDQLLLLLHFL